jgi:hypothetical protein
LLSLELVPIGTEPVDLIEHPRQQGFGRQRVYPGSLQLQDFPALAVNLDTHPLDFAAYVIKLHDALDRLTLSQSPGEQPSPGGLPVPEGAGGSIIG